MHLTSNFTSINVRLIEVLDSFFRLVLCLEPNEGELPTLTIFGSHELSIGYFSFLRKDIPETILRHVFRQILHTHS
uniref:Uncharacterized protein n=1 Tax=Rhizophora mucronata TaxID=61149 RepID=A0A2P2MMI2_RHIMU